MPGMKRAHAPDDRWTIDALGGVMDPDTLERIRSATAGFDPTAPWERIASSVLPVLRRVRHPYPPDLAPMQILVPPGIWTGFGIDIGPAFTHITSRQVEGWGVAVPDLLATALDNLRTLTGVEPPRVDRFEVDGVAIVAVQGQGWGSALLLTPDLLGPILGTDSRTLLAPARNTLVALPDPVTFDVAATVWEAVADGGADELDVPPLRWTGSAVTGFTGDLTGLPN